MSTHKNFHTTWEAAGLLGVSRRTVQLWVDSGLLSGWRTPGGHRRVTRASIAKLLSDKKTMLPPDPVQHARLRILVLEDDPPLLKLYEFMLQKWPMSPHIRLTDNGAEALNLLELEGADMMIIDLNIPGINGFQLIQLLKADAKYTGITIVAVSGLDDDILEAKKDILKDVFVLTKPVPFDTLKTIACHLERIQKTAVGEAAP